MTRDRYTRVREAFFMACDATAGERSSLLDRLEQEDARLCADVRRLLRLDESETGLLRSVLSHSKFDGAAHRPVPLDETPEVVGEYRVITKIGDGGMASVYAAEQPSPRRVVALKIVHPYNTSARTLRRFEYESDILARLDHPGIATIYQSGLAETPGGARPYFAMELVAGEDVIRHGRRHDLDLRARLALIARVCEALHHAHQKGVIHRDIKPANILIQVEDGQDPSHGQPKILDFGVARCLDMASEGHSLRTDHGQLLGTVPYMSPEQTTGDGGTLDTRTDVYSLGVVAYELLAHRLPYSIGENIPEAIEAIRTAAPIPLRRVDHSIPADVEIIIGKALAKDREDRYDSAAAFGADLLRYLASEPIEARSPSGLYRFRKLVSRNRGVAAASVALVTALLAASIVTSIGLLHASRREQDALAAQTRSDESLAEAESAVDFLTTMLASANVQDNPRQLLVLDVLNDAAERLGAADLPVLVKARLHATIGVSYLGIGQHAAAESHLLEAMTIRRRTLGDDDLLTLNCQNDLAIALRHMGRTIEAADLLEDAYTRLRRQLPETDEDVLAARGNLANAYIDLGKTDEAARLLDSLVEQSTRVRGPDHLETMRLVGQEASLSLATGDYDRALSIWRSLLERRRPLLGDDHPDTLATMRQIGIVLGRLSSIEESTSVLLEAHRLSKGRLGEQHPGTLLTLSVLAEQWEMSERFADAESAYQEVLAADRDALGDASGVLLHSLGRLGSMYRRLNRNDEAEPLLQEALEIYETEYGPNHRFTLNAMNRLALLYKAQRRFEQAEALYRETLDRRHALQGPSSPDTIVSTVNLGSLLLTLRQDEEADALFAEAIEQGTRRYGAGDRLVGIAQTYRGQTLTRLDRFEEAEAILLVANETMRALYEDTHLRVKDTVRSLMELYEAWGRDEQALEHRAWLLQLHADWDRAQAEQLAAK